LRGERIEGQQPFFETKRCDRLGQRASQITRERMKSLISIFSLPLAIGLSAILPANAQVNVTQEHNNVSRDGVYIDAEFTPSAAANLTRDLNFNGTISGNVYAQPLYIEGGPNGPMIIAVTESNNVYALDPDLVAHRYWSARPNHPVRRV
jgi:hypothetical protein